MIEYVCWGFECNATFERCIDCIALLLGDSPSRSAEAKEGRMWDKIQYANPRLEAFITNYIRFSIAYGHHGHDG